MLKFKHLFENIELATSIVNHWDFDNLEYFQYWRISSNAIYPFQNKESICHLRIAPQDEKEKDGIIAELNFLNYLKESGFDSIEPILSQNKSYLEAVCTQWGEYYATVFKNALGKSLEDTELAAEHFDLMGKTLGKLHNLSAVYDPKSYKRKDWKEILEWVEDILKAAHNEDKALEELEALRKYFSSIEVTKDNYGLIHYDFELDNIFYDEETKIMTPIDFDDSMYHWYAMDIENALNSIRECDDIEKACDIFIKGYQSERAIKDEDLKRLHIFRRFADLYKYARLLRASEAILENEPEWLVGLRAKIKGIIERQKAIFGTEFDKV